MDVFLVILVKGIKKWKVFIFFFGNWRYYLFLWILWVVLLEFVIEVLWFVFNSWARIRIFRGFDNGVFGENEECFRVGLRSNSNEVGFFVLLGKDYGCL